jgi:threonine dehydrogenase-like Zn-dependent dehydrogenase
VDEIAVVGSRCGPFTTALRMIEEKRVDVKPLIHARYPLDQGVQALEHARQKGTLKVLIDI